MANLIFCVFFVYMGFEMFWQEFSMDVFHFLPSLPLKKRCCAPLASRTNKGFPGGVGLQK